MVLEFYYDLLSQPCRAVYIFLKQAGVPFESVKIELTKGEQLKEEYLKKNPYHKVPFIVDDGFVLSESAAIVRYIAVKYKLADHWYPRSDPQKYARVDEFLHWQQMCIRKLCSEIFLETLRSRFPIGRLAKQPTDEAKVGAAKAELPRGLTHIAEYFLDGKKFITGDEISVADIIGVCELYQLNGIGQMDDLVRSNKTISDWMDRVIQELQPDFNEAVKALNGLRDKFESAGK